MDRDQLLELVPHYVVLLLLVFLTLAVLETVFGDLGFWIELVIIFLVVLAYRPVVARLGVAPSAWEE
jgi:uncharacterized membrane protein